MADDKKAADTPKTTPENTTTESNMPISVPEGWVPLHRRPGAKPRLQLCKQTRTGDDVLEGLIFRHQARDSSEAND